MTTASSYQSRKFNRQFWFVHISGLPYLFFTTLPDNWSVPSGWTYETGLAVADLNIDRTIDILGGVEDANSITINIYGDTTFGLMRKETYYSTSAEMATESFDAGEDGSLEVVHEMAGAASSGLIYRNNETISYTGKSGTTFTGIDRGRYHHLDSDLNEVKWKPAVNYAGAGPLITTIPRTMRGRLVTVYRSYFTEGTTALSKSEHEIMYRGYIQSYGQTGSGQGISFSVKSIIDLLDREIYKPAETQLKGYLFPTKSTPYFTQAKGTGLAFRETRMDYNEEKSDNSAEGVYNKLELETADTNYGENYVQIYIDITETENLNGVDDLLKLINGKVQAEYRAGNLLLPWTFVRAGSRVEVRADFVGWTYYGTDPYQIIKKGGTETFSGIIVGEVEMTPAMNALGFKGEFGTMKKLSYGRASTWRSHFARWTNPSHYSSLVNSNLPYEPATLRGSESPSAVWADLWASSDVPIKPSVSSEEFVISPNDGSPFYVWLADEFLLQAGNKTLTSSDDKLPLLNRQSFLTKPIGIRKSYDDYYLNFEEDETKYATQAWIPTCKQRVAVGSGKYEEREGIQYLILQLLTSTGTKGYNSQFDILPTNWGLNLCDDFIDLDSFEKIGDKHPQAALDRRYIFVKSFNLREMLEAEAKLLGFYIVVNNGRITCVDATAPTYNALALEIDESVRASDSDSFLQLSPEGLYNQLRIKLDYDISEEKYYYTADYVSLASITDTGKIEQDEISHRGIRSEYWLGGKDITSEIDAIMESRLEVLADESYIYECTCSRIVDNLNVGDVVNVTDEIILNPKSGTKGITKHIGVIEAMSYSVYNGLVDLTVRLRYDWDEENSNINILNSAPVINQGSFAIGARLKTYHLNKMKLILNNKQAFNFRVGDMIRVRDLASGNKVDAVVNNVDTTLKSVTISNNVPTGINLKRAEITYQPHDSLVDSASNLELTTVSLSNSSGTLTSQLKKGYKYRF